MAVLQTKPAQVDNYSPKHKKTAPEKNKIIEPTPFTHIHYVQFPILYPIAF